MVDIEKLRRLYLDGTPSEWKLQRAFDKTMTIYGPPDRGIEVWCDDVTREGMKQAKANAKWIVETHNCFAELLDEIEKLRELRKAAAPMELPLTTSDNEGEYICALINAATELLAELEEHRAENVGGIRQWGA
jgi:hypothetical protein